MRICCVLCFLLLLLSFFAVFLNDQIKLLEPDPVTTHFIFFRKAKFESRKIRNPCNGSVAQIEPFFDDDIKELKFVGNRLFLPSGFSANVTFDTSPPCRIYFYPKEYVIRSKRSKGLKCDTSIIVGQQTDKICLASGIVKFNRTTYEKLRSTDTYARNIVVTKSALESIRSVVWHANDIYSRALFSPFAFRHAGQSHVIVQSLWKPLEFYKTFVFALYSEHKLKMWYSIFRTEMLSVGNSCEPEGSCNISTQCSHGSNGNACSKHKHRGDIGFVNDGDDNDISPDVDVGYDPTGHVGVKMERIEFKINTTDAARDIQTTTAKSEPRLSDLYRSNVRLQLSELSEGFTEKKNFTAIMRNLFRLSDSQLTESVSDQDMTQYSSLLAKKTNQILQKPDAANSETLNTVMQLTTLHERWMVNVVKRNTDRTRMLVNQKSVRLDPFSTSGMQTKVAYVQSQEAILMDNDKPVFNIKLGKETRPTSDMAVVFTAIKQRNPQPQRRFRGLMESSSRSSGESQQIISDIVGASLTDSVSEVRVKFVLTHGVIDSALLNRRKCVFWKHSDQNMSDGAWVDDGCWVLPESSLNSTHCECNHLTNFAVLMDYHGLVMDVWYLSVLSDISIIICMISLALFLFVVAIVFPRKTMTFIYISLCGCLFMGYGCFLVGYQLSDRMACKIATLFTQYFLVAAFMWKLIFGVLAVRTVLQVAEFRVSTSQRNIILSVGFGLPLLLAFISFSIFYSDYGTIDRCWFKPASGAFWFFLTPIVCVILMNTALLATIFSTLCRHYHRMKGLKSKTVFNVYFLLQATLFMGITWAVGVLVLAPSFTVIASFLFPISTLLQSLSIFVALVLYKKATRDRIRLYFLSTFVGGKLSKSSEGTMSRPVSAMDKKHLSIDHSNHSYATQSTALNSKLESVDRTDSRFDDDELQSLLRRCEADNRMKSLPSLAEVPSTMASPFAMHKYSSNSDVELAQFDVTPPSFSHDIGIVSYL